jgi:hypothetical protein
VMEGDELRELLGVIPTASPGLAPPPGA